MKLREGNVATDSLSHQRVRCSQSRFQKALFQNPSGKKASTSLASPRDLRLPSTYRIVDLFSSFLNGRSHRYDLNHIILRTQNFICQRKFVFNAIPKSSFRAIIRSLSLDSIRCLPAPYKYVRHKEVTAPRELDTSISLMKAIPGERCLQILGV